MTVQREGYAPGIGYDDRAPDRVEGLVPRALDWLRRNFFGSLGNSALTLAVLGLLFLVLPPLLRWVVTDATISGATKAACEGEGACWTFIRMRLPLFFYGHYPPEETWRVVLTGLLLAAFSVPVLRDSTRRRGFWVLMLLTVFPALATLLLVGGVLGLPYVDTTKWGGLMLDVLVAFVVVAGSLPLGILLALGRRSELMIVKTISICFIEFWRAVPLLAVLIISALMIPLFLPDGVHIDRLIRALVALVLFNGAYMAETVRGGLQGVPMGQEEAAYSVGLRWWQVQAFVVLPQALRHVMPGIVNNVVDLFKDTTLVTIIGLFDVLGAINQALKDPAWLGFAREGYVFTMVMFFVCCFAMSSYARRMERRLNRHKTGRK
ncbi:MAG TPA: amino acid ABC transporter permease [Stellaceae bacterium]|nr:amino acid ABC transporter permease [Stellaceae bacterium]